MPTPLMYFFLCFMFITKSLVLAENLLINLKIFFSFKTSKNVQWKVGECTEGGESFNIICDFFNVFLCCLG